MHRVKPRCYELVGTRTASVRDQMLRATLLVKALCRQDERELNADSALLVIGGGAAGACAAMTASILGVNCLVVEREEFMFSRQIGVTTRRLHPTEYDWPQDHSGRDWPPAGRPDLGLPLRYRNDAYASELATDWQVAFTKAVDDSGRVVATRRRGTIRLLQPTDRSVLDIQSDINGVRISSATATLPMTEFGAAISCVGQGSEKVSIFNGAGTSVPAYKGPEFWGSDGLSEQMLQTMPVGATSRKPVRALVSGGGDGAQQDIQRILCVYFGAVLLERVYAVLPAMRVVVGGLDAVLRQADLDRHSVLSRPTRTPSEAELAISDWNQLYANAALGVWNGLDIQEKALVKNRLLRDEVLSNDVQLTWVQRHRDTGYCFGLNRFVTELVLLAYAFHVRRPPWVDPSLPLSWDRSAIPIGLVGHEILAVSGSNKHRCALDKPEDCHGQSHEVRFGRAGSRLPSLTGDYNVIIVRHGVDPSPVFGMAPDTEQSMPFGFD